MTSALIIGDQVPHLEHLLTHATCRTRAVDA